jgi:hypothetical protein
MLAAAHLQPKFGLQIDWIASVRLRRAAEFGFTHSLSMRIKADNHDASGSCDAVRATLRASLAEREVEPKNGVRSLEFVCFDV